MKVEREVSDFALDLRENIIFFSESSKALPALPFDKTIMKMKALV